MKIAEDLYQKGFISYPRTETNSFSQDFDIKAMARVVAQNGAPWSGSILFLLLYVTSRESRFARPL